MLALPGFRPTARRPGNLRGLGRSCGFRDSRHAGPVTARQACATQVSRDEPQEVGRTHSTRSAGEPRTGGRGPQSMHLERETRSLHSEGKHSGHRARKDDYRGNSTGQANSARSQGTEAHVHLGSPPAYPRQAASQSQPHGQDQCNGRRWTQRRRGHCEPGLGSEGGAAADPYPRVSSAARAESVDTQTGQSRKAPYRDSHCVRPRPPEKHSPGVGSHL